MQQVIAAKSMTITGSTVAHLNETGRVAGTNAASGHATFIKETPPYMVNTMKTRIISQGFLPDEAGDNIRLKTKRCRKLFLRASCIVTMICQFCFNWQRG